MIMGEYKFDADEKEIYKGIVEEIIEAHPELLEEAIKASTITLDPYSEYYSVEELESFANYIGREYVGILLPHSLLIS